MAKPKYKSLGENDNATTTPGRATFPVGSIVHSEAALEGGAENVVYVAPKILSKDEKAIRDNLNIANPSTAPAGALSGGNGNAPVNNPASGAWANYTANQPAYNPATTIINTLSSIPRNVADAFGTALNSVTSTNRPPQASPPNANSFLPAEEFALTYNQNNRGRGTNRAPNQPNNPYAGSPYSGTAGMYTYGQFSDPAEAFATLLDRGVPTNIPAALADSYGMTPVLQQPNSGWTMRNGNWVNTGAGGGAGTPANMPNPQAPYGGFQNTGGSRNTDYANTAYAQYAAANEIPFLEQLRWDPARGKYVTVGTYLKQEKEREMKRNGTWWKYHERARGQSEAYSYESAPEAGAGFTGSWGVVNFNTGSG